MTSSAATTPTTYATFIRRRASTRFVLLATAPVCPSADEIAAQVEEGQHVAAVVRVYHGDLPIPKRVSSWRTDPGRTELACSVLGTRPRAPTG